MMCQDIMKNEVECLSPSDTAQSAARRMRELNIGFLPVCDASGKAIGTLTDRDLTIRLVAENRPGDTAVSALMTREVVACGPKDDIQKAQNLMAQHHKSRIIVMESGGRIAGVISLSDIAENVDAFHAAQTIKQVSQRETRRG
jgi:CBS domain-containing protein